MTSDQIITSSDFLKQLLLTKDLSFKDITDEYIHDNRSYMSPQLIEFIKTFRNEKDKNLSQNFQHSYCPLYDLFHIIFVTYKMSFAFANQPNNTTCFRISESIFTNFISRGSVPNSEYYTILSEVTAADPDNVLSHFLASYSFPLNKLAKGSTYDKKLARNPLACLLYLIYNCCATDKIVALFISNYSNFHEDFVQAMLDEHYMEELNNFFYYYHMCSHNEQPETNDPLFLYLPRAILATIAKVDYKICYRSPMNGTVQDLDLKIPDCPGLKLIINKLEACSADLRSKMVKDYYLKFNQKEFLLKLSSQDYQDYEVDSEEVRMNNPGQSSPPLKMGTQIHYNHDRISQDQPSEVHRASDENKSDRLIKNNNNKKDLKEAVKALDDMLDQEDSTMPRYDDATIDAIFGNACSSPGFTNLEPKRTESDFKTLSQLRNKPVTDNPLPNVSQPTKITNTSDKLFPNLKNYSLTQSSSGCQPKNVNKLIEFFISCSMPQQCLLQFIDRDYIKAILYSMEDVDVLENFNQARSDATKFRIIEDAVFEKCQRQYHTSQALYPSDSSDKSTLIQGGTVKISDSNKIDHIYRSIEHIESLKKSVDSLSKVHELMISLGISKPKLDKPVELKSTITSFSTLTHQPGPSSASTKPAGPIKKLKMSTPREAPICPAQNQKN